MGGRGGGGTRPDAISTSLCRLRRRTNECRLEEEQNTRDFPLFKPKSGGDISYVVPTKLKSGGDASPPSPTDLRPWQALGHVPLQPTASATAVWVSGYRRRQSRCRATNRPKVARVNTELLLVGCWGPAMSLLILESRYKRKTFTQSLVNMSFFTVQKCFMLLTHNVVVIIIFRAR